MPFDRESRRVCTRVVKSAALALCSLSLKSHANKTRCATLDAVPILLELGSTWGLAEGGDYLAAQTPSPYYTHVRRGEVYTHHGRDRRICTRDKISPQAEDRKRYKQNDAEGGNGQSLVPPCCVHGTSSENHMKFFMLTTRGRPSVLSLHLQPRAVVSRSTIYCTYWQWSSFLLKIHRPARYTRGSSPPHRLVFGAKMKLYLLALNRDGRSMCLIQGDHFSWQRRDLRRDTLCFCVKRCSALLANKFHPGRR